MLNKITYKDNPELVELVIFDANPIVLESEHRRGSNFFTVWVIEVKPEWVPDNPELVGFWKTPRFVHDTENCYEECAIHELTRVKSSVTEKTIQVTEWIEIEE